MRDDGVGFTPAAVGDDARNGHSFGLTAMRQRVDRLAATLDVESQPGAGTAISATVPAILRGEDR